LGGLNLRTRDYAKFGQLFLQGGEWEGEQLIPVDWVKDSTVNHAPNLHPLRGSGYGYQWWVPMPQEGLSKGDFFAVGIYGQYVYINPAMNIVIAKNAADREFTQAQSNGQHSMNMNIDMFRSLAEQLAPKANAMKSVELERLPIIMRPINVEDLSVLNDGDTGSCSFIYDDEFIFFSVGSKGHYKGLNGMEILDESVSSSTTTKLNTKHSKGDLKIWLEKSDEIEESRTSITSIWNGSLNLLKGGHLFVVNGEIEC